MNKVFQPNDVKIYDRMSHRSFTVNRNDINVAKTRRVSKWRIEPIVCVHDSAFLKTPGYSGFFFASKKTWNMITKTDRKTWR